MKISELIEQLQAVKKREGNIEVTCTGSFLPDQFCPLPDVFETTVENLTVGTWKRGAGKDAEIIGRRVRLCL